MPLHMEGAFIGVYQLQPREDFSVVPISGTWYLAYNATGARDRRVYFVGFETAGAGGPPQLDCEVTLDGVVLGVFTVNPAAFGTWYFTNAFWGSYTTAVPPTKAFFADCQNINVRVRVTGGVPTLLQSHIWQGLRVET